MKINNMIIQSFVALIMLLYSCESDSINKSVETEKLSRYDFEESFIKLLPSKGLIIRDDSILLGKCTIDQLISMVDTISISLALTINEPMGLVLTTMDSPPPGYTGEYQHRPDEYFMNYSGNIKIDSLILSFTFSHSGQEQYDSEIFVDSLYLSKIKVARKTNIGLFPDLKIGDSYEQIFNYYEKPTYYCNSDLIRKEHKENGVIFTIETDSADLEYYEKIEMIEINGLTKY